MAQVWIEKMCVRGGAGKETVNGSNQKLFQKLLIASEMFKKGGLKIKNTAKIVKEIQ